MVRPSLRRGSELVRSDQKRPCCPVAVARNPANQVVATARSRTRCPSGELSPRKVEQPDRDRFARAGATNEEIDTTPECLERLERCVVQQHAERCRHDVVHLGHECPLLRVGLARHVRAHRAANKLGEVVGAGAARLRGPPHRKRRFALQDAIEQAPSVEPAGFACHRRRWLPNDRLRLSGGAKFAKPREHRHVPQKTVGVKVVQLTKTDEFRR